jgi:hypothetical protein
MNLSKIDQYFLTRDAPLGRIHRFNLKRIRLWLISLGILALFVILFIPTVETKKDLAATTVDNNTSVSQVASQASLQGPPSNVKDGDFYLSNVSASGLGGGRHSGSTRQLSASQVVKPQGNGLGFGLSSGTSIPAKVVNRIVTSDSRSPVIAIVTNDATSQGGFTVPAGTKVLGNAQADPGSDRVQVTFHTLVFESGLEQPFSAVAVMPDGSSGIDGDYHSQMLKKEGGRFLSNFVSGFASSFKDREKGGVLPFEPGNLKNAALGGVSESASEQAKAYGEEMKNVKPFITVEPETPFLIFLEKGMSL